MGSMGCLYSDVNGYFEFRFEVQCLQIQRGYCTRETTVTTFLYDLQWYSKTWEFPLYRAVKEVCLCLVFCLCLCVKNVFHLELLCLFVYACENIVCVYFCVCACVCNVFNW